MDTVSIIVGCSWTVAGVAAIAAAIPLVRGRIRRNAFYGVKFPQSYQSDEAWYAINRYGGQRMIAWSVPLVLVGIGSFFLPMRSHPTIAVTAGFAPLLFVLAPVLEAWRFARRYRHGR